MPPAYGIAPEALQNLGIADFEKLVGAKALPRVGNRSKPPFICI